MLSCSLWKRLSVCFSRYLSIDLSCLLNRCPCRRTPAPRSNALHTNLLRKSHHLSSWEQNPLKAWGFCALFVMRHLPRLMLFSMRALTPVSHLYQSRVWGRLTLRDSSTLGWCVPELLQIYAVWIHKQFCLPQSMFSFHHHHHHHHHNNKTKCFFFALDFEMCGNNYFRFT